MDDKEQSELEALMEDEQVLGRLASQKKAQLRSGKGFRWDSQTGKYTPL